MQLMVSVPACFGTGVLSSGSLPKQVTGAARQPGTDLSHCLSPSYC